MRPIWSGALSFGLINVPVKLYSALQEHEISFDLLHKKDLSPIRYAKICKAEEQEVPYKDVVKGYQYQKGEYVVITDEDFANANQKRGKTIELQSFTYEKEIDSVYFEKPYFLEPDKGAAKAFYILREALLQSEKVAVAIFALKNREHVAIVRPYQNALVLNQLRFQSQVRDPADLDLPATAKNSSKEVEMAVKLIDQLTEPFKPENFKDHYVEDMKEIIENKLKGIKPSAKPKEPKYTKVQDLMGSLKASLQQFRSPSQKRFRAPARRKVKTK